MSELGKCRSLGYYPEPNGRSYYRVKCECGRIVYIYAWRGTKKCDCGKVLSIKYSPSGRDIPVSDSDLLLDKFKSTVITAPCVSCGKELHYVHGVGWSHDGSKEFDHPAIPVPDSIRRRQERS